MVFPQEANKIGGMFFFSFLTNMQEHLLPLPGGFTNLIFQERPTSSHPAPVVVMGAAMWETAPKW